MKNFSLSLHNQLHLNTSYVSIQLYKNPMIICEDVFKYILCFYSIAEEFGLTVEIKKFKYILCFYSIPDSPASSSPSIPLNPYIFNISLQLLPAAALIYVLCLSYPIFSAFSIIFNSCTW